MERRRHGANETAYLLNPYHYREWDWCKRCRRVQHYEKYKENKLMSAVES
jgi:hypothetical protein